MCEITFVVSRLGQRILHDSRPDFPVEDRSPKASPEFLSVVLFASENLDRFSDDLTFVSGNLSVKIVRIANDSISVDYLDDCALIERTNVIVKEQTRFFAVGNVGDESERLDGIPPFVINDMRMVMHETYPAIGMENAVIQIVFVELPDFDVLVNLFLHPHEIVRIDEFEQGFPLSQKMFRTESEILRHV